MKNAPFHSFFILLLAALPAMPAAAADRQADLQFFGDLFVPKWVLDATRSTPEQPRFLKGVLPMLESAKYNVVNFEGAATKSFYLDMDKKYSLRMPLSVPPLLKAVGINVATLANNHAMDFDLTGLRDTVWELNRNGIATVGAGLNAHDALRPLVFAVDGQTVCITNFSRTLPESFWARGNNPGTAFSSFEGTAKLIRECSERGWFTVAVFHWGAENKRRPKKYQRELAQLSIRAGAHLVVGHHPHVLQTIEFYRGKPILYSLGNFAFGTAPKRPMSGAAVRVFIKEKSIDDFRIEIEAINVDNEIIKFRPRQLKPEEPDPIGRLLTGDHTCKRKRQLPVWSCPVGR